MTKVWVILATKDPDTWICGVYDSFEEVMKEVYFKVQELRSFTERHAQWYNSYHEAMEKYGHDKGYPIRGGNNPHIVGTYIKNRHAHALGVAGHEPTNYVDYYTITGLTMGVWGHWGRNHPGKDLWEMDDNDGLSINWGEP
jgi:hypothetical protein